MKKLLPLLTWLLIMQSLSAQDKWTRKADFGGGGREGGVAFSIGTKGYLGTGDDAGPPKKDFWEFDPSTNTWTQKADFDGEGRFGAAGFSIGGKGYIGTGFILPPNSVGTKDFWEYEPVANTWTRKADFGGTARGQDVGFSIGNKGYIGTGFTGYGSCNLAGMSDFWEYDPSTDKWTQKADFAGGVRVDAVGFCIGTKGYIGTGSESKSFAGNVNNKKDFWEYDPISNTWKQEANFPGEECYLATGFSIGTKGYIGLGELQIRYSRDFYEFDQAKHTWLPIASFSGEGRQGPVGFSIGTKGYVGMGFYFDGDDNYMSDFYEYASSTTLPVTLTIVKAYLVNAGVQIDWTTQQESNIEKYEVEKSNNAQQFSYFASVQAKGNNSVIVKYNLFDPNPFSGVNYFRIKTIDKSGWATYSEVIKLDITHGITSLNIYPNPIKGSTVVIQINNLGKGNYYITLSNQIGQTLLTKTIEHTGGSVTETIDAGKVLGEGVYHLRLTGIGTNIIRQLIKN